jgi:hypothetical protein
MLSLVLALPGLIGIDPIETARGLQVLLFAANAILVGSLVRAYSDSTRLGALASALFLSWEVPLEIHSWAWSEPLFICLALIGFSLLSAYLDNQRARFLVASGLFIGLAFLTRYIGLTVVLAASLAILSFSRHGRTRSLLIFSIISLLPMAIWQIHLQQSGASSREFGFHPPPVNLTDTIQLLLPAVLVMGIGALSRRLPPGPGPTWARRIPPILSRFVMAYILLFPLPLIFLDASTPVDTRLLSPVYISVLILVICFVSDLRPWLQKRRSRQTVALATAGVLLGIHLLEGVPLVLERFEDGAGYASHRWRESELMAHVAGLKPDLPIFSNAQDAIFLLARRPAFSLPATVDLVSGKEQTEADQNLEALVSRIDANEGILVWFHEVDRFFLPSRNEIARRLDRPPIGEFSDGVIYGGR